jgi:pimeloyl-ACP methyl ester carboxylesterase
LSSGFVDDRNRRSRVAAFAETRLDVNGIETAVLTSGKGEPLVFFHGGGIVEGVDCLRPLAERFRLIVPYHPGFDGTASDPAISGIGDWLRHYLALFELLGVDEVTLVGHSLGGWLAALFAIDNPRRISRLVLASPFGLDAPGHPIANLGAVAPMDVYALLTRDPAVFAGRLPVPLGEEFLAARAREGEAIGQVLPGPFDPTLAEKLRHLKAPTLLLWGTDDQIVPVEHAPLWESALPSVVSRTFEGGGHLLFWENRESVDAALAFAEGVP